MNSIQLVWGGAVLSWELWDTSLPPHVIFHPGLLAMLITGPLERTVLEAARPLNALL